MIQKILLVLFLAPFFCSKAQKLPGFIPFNDCGEQQRMIENCVQGTRILINAPATGFEKGKKVMLIFYALPNGNTIEQTFGKKIEPGDDWHFDIQHIGAQTRFLRKAIKNRTVVVAYVENNLKSWPAWKAKTPDYREQVLEMVNRVTKIFEQWNPEIALSGHSGGGRFIFSFLDAVDEIPENVRKIAFLDSNYGYEDSLYFGKIVRWANSNRRNSLCVLAYNDSVVIYNGKPLVSPIGGTWYRSRMMLKSFSDLCRFKPVNADSLLWYNAMNGRLQIILKPNPEGKIFHTVQVERNGFIHSMLCGTKQENKGYTYFGERAYFGFLSDQVPIMIGSLNIPGRNQMDETGSEFMERIRNLTLTERDMEIHKALERGNIPGFLRNTVRLAGNFTDSFGVYHSLVYETLPDYLAVGSDSDYCRIPMNPRTAQRIADAYGGSLITSKISDHIFSNAVYKPEPFFYKPVGNANETIEKFVEHNAKINEQLKNMKALAGKLVAGIKKDVILSERISRQPDKVVIYGWHKPDSKPIQPVYSGHVWWYVDYSHGIRLINNRIFIDNKPALFSDLLKDPVLFRVVSNEERPMGEGRYKY